MALWLGTIILGNLAMGWKILVFVIDKVNEYNNMKKTVEKLEAEKEKQKKDINAAHEMIRNLKKEH